MESSQKDSPPVCDYEGSDYQSSFWDTGERAYEDQVEAIALKRLLPNSGNLLLEVGAGAGRNTPRYKGYERIVVMDYSTTQLQQAQERLGKDDKYIYVAADVYRLPFMAGLFDGATMIRVIHHMSDAPLALKQIRESLQPGSTFILEFANKKNLKAILRYLLKKQDWNPFSPEPVEFVELNFDFHPKTIREWLGNIGFKIERQLTVSHFRIGFIKRLVPTRLLVWLDSLAQFTGGLWQFSPSVFVKSQAIGDTTVAPEGTFFRCPECKTPLAEEKNNKLKCECGLTWGIEDEIYNFKDPIK
ncbi:MAG: class I SAM-dependent methyltransferase [Chloroflexi bacterium]|jgi:ubiquinone/menaquinone biosynthesis C-methylase UbiE|nr:class I SAM-dependent methyltransferase [Chloroflexota bacterium]MBT3670546.1 class I SAM-dependent methyltransferase [Chloroflexota bacterium]MBT4003360.1 class I SAM-dependent methyltransferase [Chloroflexota bacterium]MBT4304181.1 class I SAM-dependent methyltransferase [Chloroflexota bacterium]MBT4533460.1 class I SAM-dependent methyltransferase [Chloroflexota bacterium]